MTPDKLKAARRRQKEGTPVAEIARTLSVGRATLYRHLQPAGER